MPDRFQIVWWGWPWRTESHWVSEAGAFAYVTTWNNWAWGFDRLKPLDGLSVVYEWRLFLGPLEVRRWVPDSREALAAHRDAMEDFNAAQDDAARASGKGGKP